MQNTQTGTKGSSKQLHQITESVRDTAENLASDFGSKAKDLASNTADAAGQYYNRASSWVEQNYGKTLGLVGLVAVGGLIGYMLGRNKTFERSDIH